MGIFFGRTTGTRPYSYAADLATKLERRGGNSSTGAAQLLGVMRYGGDPRDLCPEEAEQAARSIGQAARKLRGVDRQIAEQIAKDAQAAADSGHPWRVG
ncbi:DUF7739 domain-containing protein [Streptosporangium saharense]|uniref:DUF7739 domain-containing protein n=1 Tax=Streptosporangium saharense TaxID=1706840 RepID=UPI0033248C0E